MVKIGLIGAGIMGITHGLCYEALSDRYSFKVTAVADSDLKKAKELADKFGVQTYDSAEELIEKAGVDAVDICLPTWLHEKYSILAMKHGIHVLVEKPVCLHEKEAYAMLEMQKKSGVKAMVAHCVRFMPEYEFLARLVAENTYGKLLSGYFKRISQNPGYSAGAWLNDQEKSGSAALDMHIHDVDFVRSVFGNPLCVKSEVLCRNGRNEHIVALYRYKDAMVSMEAGWDYPQKFRFEAEYRISLEKAAVTYRSGDDKPLKIYLEDGTMVIPDVYSVNGVDNGEMDGIPPGLLPYCREIVYFLRCIEEDREIEIASLAEAVDSLKLTLQGIRGGT